jgi:hypothetical protein
MKYYRLDFFSFITHARSDLELRLHFAGVGRVYTHTHATLFLPFGFPRGFCGRGTARRAYDTSLDLGWTLCFFCTFAWRCLFGLFGWQVGRLRSTAETRDWMHLGRLAYGLVGAAGQRRAMEGDRGLGLRCVLPR